MRQKLQALHPQPWLAQDSHYFQAGEIMYNRYIPQPDGSFRRNYIPDPLPPRPAPSPEPDCPPPPPPQECPPPQTKPECAQPPHRPPCRENTGAGDFLRRLLPKNLDTGDLLVIILLLLMAGDCAEDKNTALLTLALYLFM